MAIIWSIKHVCSKNFIIIQLLKESDFCSTFALFYQNQFVLKFYHKKGKGFQKWSIFWQLFEKKKEKWKLQSAELSKTIWRSYWRGWNRVMKTDNWRVEAGQKVYLSMVICWNSQKVNQSSFLIEYEWFIHISQSTLQTHKQKKRF